MQTIAPETHRIPKVAQSAIVRQINVLGDIDMDSFMETFDQAVTEGECKLTWSQWAKLHKVEEHDPMGDVGIIIALGRRDPYLLHPANKAERVDFDWELDVLLYGGEDAYIHAIMNRC